MDISRASNFERFVFDLVDRDGGALKALWARLDSEGRIDLSDSPRFAAVASRYGFASGRASHDECIATIREVAAQCDVVIDPHTAVAAKVAREHLVAGVPMIVLETAKPAKFNETIREALGRDADVPPGFEGLLDRPQHSTTLAADAAAVKRFIADHV
jgi:threonine synthase